MCTHNYKSISLFMILLYISRRPVSRSQKTENSMDHWVVILILCGVALAQGLQTNSVSGFYRIEVEFGQYENNNGYASTKLSCDEITPCDPVLYSYIDVERPSALWANAVKADSLSMLTWRRNTNSYAVNQTITKDICGGALSNVNVRVEVMDEDFLGKYDLIERFECKFFPGVIDSSLRENPQDRDSFKNWSAMDECTALHLPTLIRLFYRWRVFPVTTAECGKEIKTASKSNSTSNNTPKPA